MWLKILSDVRRGSLPILCTVFFNIHLCDSFAIMSDIDIANFADNNTPCISAEKIKSLVKSQKSTACRISKWYSDKQLK